MLQGGGDSEEGREAADLRDRARRGNGKCTCVFVGVGMLWMIRKLLWRMRGHLPLLSPWVGRSQ